jgi:hypothetical protein
MTRRQVSCDACENVPVMSFLLSVSCSMGFSAMMVGGSGPSTPSQPTHKRYTTYPYTTPLDSVPPLNSWLGATLSLLVPQRRTTHNRPSIRYSHNGTFPSEATTRDLPVRLFCGRVSF